MNRAQLARRFGPIYPAVPRLEIYTCGGATCFGYLAALAVDPGLPLSSLTCIERNWSTFGMPAAFTRCGGAGVMHRRMLPPPSEAIETALVRLSHVLAYPADDSPAAINAARLACGLVAYDDHAPIMPVFARELREGLPMLCRIPPELVAGYREWALDNLRRAPTAFPDSLRLF